MRAKLEGETFGKSCGCLNREETIKRNTKHGQASRQTHSSEFNTWVCMRQRCTNSKLKDYKYYGGRGIKVCMGAKPTPEHSIERKNNNRGYSPSNCKWATAKEQAANRRPRSQ